MDPVAAAARERPRVEVRELSRWSLPTALMVAELATAMPVQRGNYWEFLNDSAIFPTPEVVTRLEFLKDLGDDEETYDQAWERLKKS